MPVRWYDTPHVRLKNLNTTRLPVSISNTLQSMAQILLKANSRLLTKKARQKTQKYTRSQSKIWLKPHLHSQIWQKLFKSSLQNFDKITAT